MINPCIGCERVFMSESENMTSNAILSKAKEIVFLVIVIPKT
jgi:hypothetical protein